MATGLHTVICGTCPHRDPVATLREAVARARRHREQHPGHVVTVKDPTGLTMAERFFAE